MNNDESITLTSSIKQQIWTWRDLIIILLGTGLILVIGGFLIIAIGMLRTDSQDLVQPNMAQSLAAAALEAVALVAGIYLFGLRRKGLDWQILGIKTASGVWILITLIVSVFAIPLTGLITLLIMLVLGLPLENPQVDFLLPDDISLMTAALMILLAGILVPIAEELIFRGFLYNFLKERWGVWPGVFISALVFAIIHGNVIVGVTAFFLGIILAILYEYSHSLWTSILFHAVNNSAKIALLYILIVLGLDNLV
jgi:membrane protease YdiL (CAAX protease family)